MSRTTVLPVIGTRPEAIKMAPVIRALEADASFDTTVVVTAQHRHLLDDVLDTFTIRPHVDLNLMRADQSPTAVAARVLTAMEPVLQQFRPDWVLVEGDTTTVMATAIAAHYAGVKVGHIEAGLRSYDRRNPFPEEANRVVTGHLSDLHFAPTRRARSNLLREGMDPETILVTGNTVVDALQLVTAAPWSPPFESALSGLPEEKRWILVTAHRRENFGEPLRDVCTALLQLADRGDVHIVYPVHPNPNVHDTVYAMLGQHPAITLLGPVSYRPLVWLLEHAALVLTDSGGIQEEAPALGKPVLVLRETTERPEAIEAGLAMLVGTNPARIVAETERLLDDPAAYAAMARAISPYGDGRAALRIVHALRGDRLPDWDDGHAG